MEAFLSSYPYKVDAKGRLSIPAAYRQILCRNESRSFIGFIDLSQPAIRCCGREILDRISVNRDPLAMFLPAQPDEILDMVPEMQDLNLDDEGRIMLPKHLAEYAGITKQVMFVGRFNYFEIWDHDRFQAVRALHIEELRRKQAALAAGAKLPAGGASP